MQKGKAFVGFHEATVNFPPTFKYDVPRTPKGNKTPRGEIQATRSTNHVQDLTEIGEKHSTDEGSENSSHDERDNDAVDSVSFASSMWTRRSTSVYSHRTMDEEEAEGNEDSAPTFILPKSPKILDKVFLAHAAQKAKYKWLKLISSPSLPNTPNPTPYADRRFSTLDVNIPSTPRPYQSALQLTPRPQTPASKGVRSSLRRSRSKRSSAVVSTMSGATSPDEGDNDHDDKYDSSSKQRVPSWFVPSLLDNFFVIWTQAQLTGVTAFYGNRRPKAILMKRLKRKLTSSIHQATSSVDLASYNSSIMQYGPENLVALAVSYYTLAVLTQVLKLHPCQPHLEMMG